MFIVYVYEMHVNINVKCDLGGLQFSILRNTIGHVQ